MIVSDRTSLNNSELQTIEDILKLQTETYQQVVDVMQQKREAIITSDHKRLAQVDQTLITLGHRSLQLEKERLEKLAEMGLPNTTLSQLLEFVKTKTTYPVQPLTLARQQLNQVIEEVQRQNDHNRRLLDLSIQWIEKTVEVIAKAVAPQGAAYNQQGNTYSAAKGKQAKNHYATLPQSTVVRDI